MTLVVPQAALDVADILEERRRLARELGKVLAWDKHAARLAGQAATPLRSTLGSTADPSQRTPACPAHALAPPPAGGWPGLAGAGLRGAGAPHDPERSAQAAPCTRAGADPAPNPAQGGGAAAACARTSAAATPESGPGAEGAACAPASAPEPSSTASLGLHAASFPALVLDSEDAHAGAPQPMLAATAPAAVAAAPPLVAAATAAPPTAEAPLAAPGPVGDRTLDPTPDPGMAGGDCGAFLLRLTLGEPTQAEHDAPVPGGQAGPAVRVHGPEQSPLGTEAAAAALQALAAEPEPCAAGGAAHAGPLGTEMAADARPEPGSAWPGEPGSTSTVESEPGLGRGSRTPYDLRAATAGGGSRGGEPDQAAGPGPACADAGAAGAMAPAAAAAVESAVAAPGQDAGGAASARAASGLDGGLGHPGADRAGSEHQVEPADRGAAAEGAARGALGQAGQAGVGCSLQDGLGAWWAGGWSVNPTGSAQPQSVPQEPTAGPQVMPANPVGPAGTTTSPAPRGALEAGSPDPCGNPASTPQAAGAGALASNDATPSWLVAPGARGAGKELSCSADCPARAASAAALAPAPMQAYPADGPGPSTAAGALGAEAGARGASPPPSLDPLCSFVPATALTGASDGTGRNRGGGPGHGGDGGAEHVDTGAPGRAAGAMPCTPDFAGSPPAAEAPPSGGEAAAPASTPAGEAGLAAAGMAAPASAARRTVDAGNKRRRGVIAAQRTLPTGRRAADAQQGCAAADPAGAATGRTHILRRRALLGDAFTQAEPSPVLSNSDLSPACDPGPAALEGPAEGIGADAAWVRKRHRADADGACGLPGGAGRGKRRRAGAPADRVAEDCQDARPGAACGGEPWGVAARTRRAVQDATARQAPPAAPWPSRLRRCSHAWVLASLMDNMSAHEGQTKG